MKWILAAIALLSLSGCLLSDRRLLEDEAAVPLLSDGDVSAHVLVPGSAIPDKNFRVRLLADGGYQVTSLGEISRLRFVMLEKDIYVAYATNNDGADGKTLYWLARPSHDHVVRLQLIRFTDKVGSAAVAAGASCHNFPHDPAYPKLPAACELSSKASLLAVLRVAATEPAAAADVVDLIQKK